MDQGHNDSCAGGAQGMSDSASTTMDINFCMIQAKLVHCLNDDDGKSFINFKQINVIDGPAGGIEHFLNCAYGR